LTRAQRARIFRHVTRNVKRLATVPQLSSSFLLVSNGTAASGSGSRPAWRLELPASQTASPSLLKKKKDSVLQSADFSDKSNQQIFVEQYFCVREEIVEHAVLSYQYVCEIFGQQSSKFHLVWVSLVIQSCLIVAV
jgi:hypothetical protein